MAPKLQFARKWMASDGDITREALAHRFATLLTASLAPSRELPFPSRADGKGVSRDVFERKITKILAALGRNGELMDRFNDSLVKLWLGIFTVMARVMALTDALRNN